ncbi:Response regulator receiver modulated diguanylate cyclase (modular protein) [Desulfamplus magnetovallimortis]|uniref:diguanylate cyclase n=1 Tax=Desulfamplus magnetovallimortis TaxID=1246637 RepID=A0A1W1HIJ8_9BACT|nr:diguanylate cyclase [Desulfamplus magnetovallimortis]SLM32245.1 Response regulator receiver modulated diguanylate cyclase (modular protein) [Desulfamplus magnetovallimortis]
MVNKSKARILIVDDEKINLRILVDLLKDDYALVLARSGEQALRFSLQNPPPDLILLDVIMPDMGGYEVIKKLKEHDLTKDIPVIFVTALDSVEDEEHGLKLGAVDYITKPFSPPIVKMRIHNHLRFVHQHKLLDKLAYLDALTEISNRRRFDQVLKNEFSRAMRNSTNLSLGMIDVDFFKQYNDHYGHAMGDQALHRIASALDDALKRPADLVARYGGEEFAIILPETDSDSAIQVAERTRIAVISQQIPHLHSSVSDYVSISIGIVTVCALPVNNTENSYEADKTNNSCKIDEMDNLSAIPVPSPDKIPNPTTAENCAGEISNLHTNTKPERPNVPETIKNFGTSTKETQKNKITLGGYTHELLLEEADRNLYIAKQKGRNRIFATRIEKQ